MVGTAGVEPTLPRYQHGVLTIRRHSNILALSRLTLGLALHSLPHSVITPKNQVLVDESRSASLVFYVLGTIMYVLQDCNVTKTLLPPALSECF